MGNLKRLRRSPELVVGPRKFDSHLKIDDLRALVTWCFLSSGKAPRWIGVENRTGIEHIVVVIVPGLPVVDLIDDISVATAHQVQCDRVPSLGAFEYVWPIRAHAHRDRIDPPELTFSQLPYTKSEKKAQHKEREKRDSLRRDVVPLAELLVDAKEMTKLGFKVDPPSENWRVLAKQSDVTDVTKFVAVDCEMCKTATGTTLARVSVVNEKSECIYSTFVKPEEPIIDYVTQFSGISAEKLEDVETTVADVQEWFAENIGPDTAILGHSIDCDMNAMRLIHPNIIDTGLLYPHPKGLPFRHALRWLIRKYFKEEIQTSEGGHDPTEDATACVKLLNLKREKGIDFGSAPLHKSLIETLKEEGKTTAIIDHGVPFWDFSQSAQSIISVSSDEEAISNASKQCGKHDLTFVRLRELEKAGDEAFEPALAATNGKLAQLLENIPPRSIAIVWTGYGDRKDFQLLNEKRRQWNKDFKEKKLSEIKDPWTDEDAEKLHLAVNKNRLGLAWVKVVPGELPKSAKVAKVSSNE